MKHKEVGKMKEEIKVKEEKRLGNIIPICHAGEEVPRKRACTSEVFLEDADGTRTGVVICRKDWHPNLAPMCHPGPCEYRENINVELCRTPTEDKEKKPQANDLKDKLEAIKQRMLYAKLPVDRSVEIRMLEEVVAMIDCRTSVEDEGVKEVHSQIKTKIGELVGESSMCWSETPKGVFDTTKASEIVDKLLALHIRVKLLLEHETSVKNSLYKDLGVVYRERNALQATLNGLQRDHGEGEKIKVLTCCNFAQTMEDKEVHSPDCPYMSAVAEVAKQKGILRLVTGVGDAHDCSFKREIASLKDKLAEKEKECTAHQKELVAMVTEHDKYMKELLGGEGG